MKQLGKHTILLIVYGLLLLMPSMLKAEDTLRYDTSTVELRQFSEDSLQSFREDADFIYTTQGDKLEWTWWDRLKYEVLRFLTGQTPAGKIFNRIMLVGLAVFAIGFIVFGLLKVPIQSIIGKSPSNFSIDFTELDENIHEMDFNQLIQQAIEDKAFRRAVRLLYLETLKQLTDHNLIKWKINKTNSDYRAELEGSQIADAFDKLSLDFEYVWYGDFPVNENGFRAMQKIFQQFQQQIAK